MRLGYHPHTKASRILDWKTFKMFLVLGGKKIWYFFFFPILREWVSKKLTEGPYKDVISSCIKMTL